MKEAGTVRRGRRAIATAATGDGERGKGKGRVGKPGHRATGKPGNGD